MISERVYSILSADAPLTASTNVIRPIVLRESDELPAITYQLSTEYDSTFDGVSTLKKSIAEINVYARTLSEAQSINDELKTSMANVAGIGSGVNVHSVFISREIEDYETEQDEFRINTQFSINYNEG